MKGDVLPVFCAAVESALEQLISESLLNYFRKSYCWLL